MLCAVLLTYLFVLEKIHYRLPCGVLKNPKNPCVDVQYVHTCVFRVFEAIKIHNGYCLNVYIDEMGSKFLF